jgi:hypothetical protein
MLWILLELPLEKEKVERFMDVKRRQISDWFEG